MERSARPGVVRRMVSGVWRAVDRLRQLSLNLLFIAVVVFLLAGWWASRPAPLPTDAALLVAPNGNLVEQRSAKSPISLIQGGEGIHQVLLRDVIDAIHAAATDPHIKALADQLLLQSHAPAAVLVTDAGDIVYISGRTGRYLD